MSDDDVTQDNVHELYPSDVEPPCESVPGSQGEGYKLNNVQLPIPDSYSLEKGPDMVNSPPHYTQGGVETADIIDHIVKNYSPEQAWPIANVVKYLCRAPHKGTKLLDMKKANWYLRRAIEKCKQD